MGDLSVPCSPLTVRRAMSARAAQPHPYEVQDRELSLRQTATPGLEGGDPILLLAGNTSLWLAKAIRARREISTNWEKNPWAWRQGLLQSQRAWRHRGAPARSHPCRRSPSPPKKGTCCSAWPSRSTISCGRNFCRRFAQELEAKRQAGEVGEGSVHRVARTVQRRFFDPRSCPTRARRRARRSRVITPAPVRPLERARQLPP